MQSGYLHVWKQEFLTFSEKSVYLYRRSKYIKKKVYIKEATDFERLEVPRMISELLKAFLLIFAAEMGDKTQILAMMFATPINTLWTLNRVANIIASI